MREAMCDVTIAAIASLGRFQAPLIDDMSVYLEAAL